MRVSKLPPHARPVAASRCVWVLDFRSADFCFYIEVFAKTKKNCCVCVCTHRKGFVQVFFFGVFVHSTKVPLRCWRAYRKMHTYAMSSMHTSVMTYTIQTHTIHCVLIILYVLSTVCDDGIHMSCVWCIVLVYSVFIRIFVSSLVLLLVYVMTYTIPSHTIHSMLIILYVLSIVCDD